MSNTWITTWYKSDNTLAFVSAGYASGSLASDSSILEDTVSAKGGSSSDYYVYHVTDEDIIERLFNADDCVCTLNDDSEVTGIDFSTEDAKGWLSISTDVTGDRVRRYLDGSCDEINIIAEVLLADGETRDTSFNGTLTIVTLSPNGKEVEIDADFTSGYHTERFYPADFGTYSIPKDTIRTKDGSVRVQNQVFITAYYKAS